MREQTKTLQDAKEQCPCPSLAITCLQRQLPNVMLMVPLRDISYRKSHKDSDGARTLKYTVNVSTAGGIINQAFLAHEVAVFKMATIDHVNCCHLWDRDIVKEEMPITNGSVLVPNKPGLGVTLDREKLESLRITKPQDKGRFLIQIILNEETIGYTRHRSRISWLN